MTREIVFAALAATAGLLQACSSCSSGGGAGDAGMDAGPDTDADSDSDSDGDADGGDSDTLPEGFVPDAGPWIWEDLPDAGDCGVEGCRQLTFGDEVRVLEWDVWGNLIAYNEGETTRIHVVNYEDSTVLELPNSYPGIGIGPSMGSGELSPATIYQDQVCYSRAVFQDPDFSDLICASLSQQKQSLIFHRPKEGTDFPNPGEYIDVYGTRIVSKGGCGEVMDSTPLCEFNLEATGTYQEIAPHQYGTYNSLWGNVVVWTTALADGGDIRGYDFSTEEFIEISDDEPPKDAPRVYGTKVVYMDLKLGTSGLMGDWNHAAIFMYDLESHETTQITSGEWIASFPDINENIIIWSDYRDCANPNDKNSFENVQIWGYNLDTETEFQVTDIPDRVKATSRIWGDKVFVDMAQTTPGKVNAIYMFDLPDGAKSSPQFP